MESDDLSRQIAAAGHRRNDRRRRPAIGLGRRSRRPRTRRMPPRNSRRREDFVSERGRSGGHRSRRCADHSDRRHARCARGGRRVLHRPGPRDVSSQLASDYRAQLAEFQAAFREQHPGAASFASLTSEQQVEYLKRVDHTPFFDTTRLLTLLGMFSLPAYGGNRNGVGWKLIGFEDRHVFHPPFGYYDRDYPGFVIDR